LAPVVGLRCAKIVASVPFDNDCGERLTILHLTTADERTDSRRLYAARQSMVPGCQLVRYEREFGVAFRGRIRGGGSRTVLGVDNKLIPGIATTARSRGRDRHDRDRSAARLAVDREPQCAIRDFASGVESDRSVEHNREPTSRPYARDYCIDLGCSLVPHAGEIQNRWIGTLNGFRNKRCQGHPSPGDNPNDI
jgi:hypothetical protein